MSESEQQDPWDSVPQEEQPAEPPAQPTGYGYPPPGQPGYAYGYPSAPPPGAYYGYPPVAVRKTNSLAIAALVCGICGFIYVVPGILGIIFGVVSVRQIKRDRSEGRGMAIAGIVTGAVWLVLYSALFLIVFALTSN